VQPGESASAIRELVRRQDPDRYAAALFLPRPQRAIALSLCALNAELARIPELVSEPALGEIRLQWWHDALDRVANGETVDHPVLNSLAGRIGPDLPLQKLQALVEATRFGLDRAGAPDWEALEAHCRETTGALFNLIGGLLGPKDERLQTASDVAGLAYGLTGLLRAAPRHLALGKYFLPLTQLSSSETRQAELAGIRITARRQLEEAQSAVGELPREQQTAFLPLALVEPYLAKLAECASDPSSKAVTLNPLWRLWRLLRWKP
jgi:15-cis-phytoene synthase